MWVAHGWPEHQGTLIYVVHKRIMLGVCDKPCWVTTQLPTSFWEFQYRYVIPNNNNNIILHWEQNHDNSHTELAHGASLQREEQKDKRRIHIGWHALSIVILDYVSRLLVLSGKGVPVKVISWGVYKVLILQILAHFTEAQLLSCSKTAVMYALMNGCNYSRECLGVYESAAGSGVTLFHKLIMYSFDTIKEGCSVFSLSFLLAGWLTWLWA